MAKTEQDQAFHILKREQNRMKLKASPHRLRAEHGKLIKIHILLWNQSTQGWVIWDWPNIIVWVPVVSSRELVRSVCAEGGVENNKVNRIT